MVFAYFVMLSSNHSKISILIYLFTSIILACAVSFIFVGVGWFSGELGINRTTETLKLLIPWTNYNLLFLLDRALNYHPTEAQLLFIVEILGINLIGILIILILKENREVIILPFDVNFDDTQMSGKAISEMLIVELNKILKIHASYRNIELIGNIGAITPNWHIKTENLTLDLPIIEEHLGQSMEAIGTFSLGSASLPLGQILMLIKQYCPFTEPDSIVTGCVQKFGPDLCIVSRMKWKNCSWAAHKDLGGSKERLHLIFFLSYNQYINIILLERCLRTYLIMRMLDPWRHSGI
jgi:hypothetical protein